MRGIKINLAGKVNNPFLIASFLSFYYSPFLSVILWWALQPYRNMTNCNTCVYPLPNLSQILRIFFEIVEQSLNSFVVVFEVVKGGHGPELQCHPKLESSHLVQWPRGHFHRGHWTHLRFSKIPAELTNFANHKRTKCMYPKWSSILELTMVLVS